MTPDRAEHDAGRPATDAGLLPPDPARSTADPAPLAPDAPRSTSDESIPTGHAMARSAALVMALFMAGRVFGVLDDVVKSRIFGTSGEMSAYVAAFTLPELLNNLLSAGALSAAFIPVFAGLLTRGDRRAAWRLASSILNLTFLVTSVLGLVIVAFAPEITRTLIVPGWANRPELYMVTANAMRVIVIAMVLWSFGGLATSVLHAHQHFLLPAIAPILYSSGVVAGAVVVYFVPSLGVMGLAYGVVAGMVLHALVQVPGLVRYRMQWRPVIDLRDAAVQRVIWLTLPRMAGVSVIYLNNLVGFRLASELANAESGAYLSYAWRIQQIPATIIGLGVATVLFPSMAALAAQGDRSRLRETFAWSLRIMLLLTVPASFALVVLGRQAIAFVLQGGAFSAESTEQVMFALQFYAFGLVGYSTLEIVARAMFAQQDTRTPLYVAAGALVLNAALGYLLLGPLLHGGLALASSLAVSLEVVVLLAILRHRWAGIEGRGIAVTLVRALVASGAMLLVMNGLLAPLAAWTAGLNGHLALLLQMGLAGLAGLIAYVAVALALGAPEIRAIPGLVRRRRPIAG